jgi:hypothetical protein
LDVETAWELEKCLNYTKTINWLYLGMCEGEKPCCALFEFYASLEEPGDYWIELVSAASVALVDDEDVNDKDDNAMSPPLLLIVNVPQ